PAQDIIAEYFVVPVSSIATPHKDALNINDIKTVSQDFAWDGDKNNKERLLERWNNEIGSKR
ncbi:MAG: iron ABC transporter substrate-binding protein, partial [Spirochaetaceae bacterium]|nr:iron ABC transporter substrate-binding protein [Spirochaetaceae bacterium]